MRARKRFGQHFLHDPAIIQRIVDVIDPQPGQPLVEIGPGRGALTWPVLKRSGHLHVVEVDRDLAQRLREFSDDQRELVVHEADALEFDFASLDQRPLRVFGNLPYNISTPLLFHLAGQAAAIESMVFMLQHEVVQRRCARPGSKRYGRLTVMLALVADSESLFRIGPGAFKPPPRVDSALVRITPLADPPPQPERLAELVREAFNHRRKTLRNAIAPLLTAGQIESAGLDPGQRPETVDPQGFLALARQID